jgi:hypothetical protein
MALAFLSRAWSRICRMYNRQSRSLVSIPPQPLVVPHRIRSLLCRRHDSRSTRRPGYYLPREHWW